MDRLYRHRPAGATLLCGCLRGCTPGQRCQLSGSHWQQAQQQYSPTTRHRDDADLRFLNGSEGTTLIEVATSQVVDTAVTRANIITPVAGAQSSSAHPWSVLTPAQKMGQLRDPVTREVGRLVPEVLGAKP